jgi:hypothetical protein
VAAGAAGVFEDRHGAILQSRKHCGIGLSVSSS